MNQQQYSAERRTGKELEETTDEPLQENKQNQIFALKGILNRLRNQIQQLDKRNWNPMQRRWQKGEDKKWEEDWPDDGSENTYREAPNPPGAARSNEGSSTDIKKCRSRWRRMVVEIRMHTRETGWRTYKCRGSKNYQKHTSRIVRENAGKRHRQRCRKVRKRK